jgi:hypothetical protein
LDFADRVVLRDKLLLGVMVPGRPIAVNKFHSFRLKMVPCQSAVAMFAALHRIHFAYPFELLSRKITRSGRSQRVPVINLAKFSTVTFYDPLTSYFGSIIELRCAILSHENLRLSGRERSAVARINNENHQGDDER